MSTEILLRPGVVFRAPGGGVGAIEFADGRRSGPVRHHGSVPGLAGAQPARVHVLSAARPADPEPIARREVLPALAVVPVERQYLRADRDFLFSLYALATAVEGADLDPVRTVVLTAHGSADVDETGGMTGGEPCVPATGDGRWTITLGPGATARLVRFARGPNGERVNALVNLGCFSSTPRGRTGPTFNEELAAHLAPDGIAVYGPPHAGVVTAATWFGAWRNQFGQEETSGATVRHVPIQFRRIDPPAGLKPRAPLPLPGAETYFGAVIVTNDCALAGELASYSPDFKEQKPHAIDRSLME
jgi:hypothetical protein